MLLNYLKTTIRHLFKSKTYGILNLFGLAIGLTCASLIFLWTEDELNFDHNFANHDRIYRIYENQTYEGKTSTFVATPGPMAKAVAAEIPGIAVAARSAGSGSQLLSVGEKVINDQGRYVDSSFLSIFDLPFIYGTSNAALAQLQSIAISEKLSKKFFGNDNPVGRAIRLNNEQDFTVSAVFKDLPGNSTLQFEWLAPIQNIDNKQPWMQFWGANWAHTFVLLEKNADVNAINNALKKYLSTKDDKLTTECFLFAMNDWNLYGNFVDGKQDGGRIVYVRLFSYIAWIILLIACINFMNLATARSEQRAKEVGLRKVVGARKWQLIGQFLAESLIMAFAAVGIAVLLAYLSLPFFNGLVDKQLSLNLFSPFHVSYLLAIALITGLVAGSYPAFYLSSFQPIAVLKKMFVATPGGAATIRKVLVVGQFSVSIFIMIATVIIYKQIEHVKSRNLGYDRNRLVYMEMDEKAPQRFDALYASLKNTGVVEHASLSEYPILQIWNNSDNFSWRGKDAAQNPLITWENVSADFTGTMDITIKEGRNFYDALASDSNAVLINESLAKLMGKEGRVGGTITKDNNRLEIVGIVKDFVYNNMYEQPGPLLLFHSHNGASNLSIRIARQADLPTALARIETAIKASNPAYPVDLKFIDEDFNRLLKTETLTGRLAGVFALLSVIISCLGLFGLAAYTAQQRMKEIGIRKVLGASVAGLTGLLCRDFLMLVMASFLFALPFAWWALHHWLQGYAYRITLSWWLFALPGACALFISIVTVSGQAIRSALANPVKTIR